jgi:hypothetical protein
MSDLPLARSAGPVATGAGALFVVAQVLLFLVTDRNDLAGTLAGWPYRSAAVLLLVGFVGLAVCAVALYERQAGESGWLGVLALCAALLGTMNLAGNCWFETFAVPWISEVLPQLLTIPGAGWLAVGGTASYYLFAIGWLLFAVAGFRTRVFPRLPCIGLALGGIVGFLALRPPYGVVLGVALVWLGIASIRLSSDRRQPPSLPDSVAQDRARVPGPDRSQRSAAR